jgi:hypothetical protein
MKFPPKKVLGGAAYAIGREFRDRTAEGVLFQHDHDSGTTFFGVNECFDDFFVGEEINLNEDFVFC